jgi:hypothetical protein
LYNPPSAVLAPALFISVICASGGRMEQAIGGAFCGETLDVIAPEIAVIGNQLQIPHITCDMVGAHGSVRETEMVPS